MKNLLTIFILFFTSLHYSQDYSVTDAEIKTKLDSIKKEGNLLYSLENASWHATDLANENRKVKHLTGTYLSYASDKDTVKTVFMNNTGDKIVVEYSFVNNSKKPAKESFTVRDLTDAEAEMRDVRKNVISQLSDPKYEVAAPPSGFNFNAVILPYGEQYKTYLITGAAESGVIPFGNDYLFMSDKKGKISDHKKFHSRLIPAHTNSENMGEMTMSTHSHLRTNPLFPQPTSALLSFMHHSPNFRSFRSIHPHFRLTLSTIIKLIR